MVEHNTQYFDCIVKLGIDVFDTSKSIKQLSDNIESYFFCSNWSPYGHGPYSAMVWCLKLTDGQKESFCDWIISKFSNNKKFNILFWLQVKQCN